MKNLILLQTQKIGAQIEMEIKARVIVEEMGDHLHVNLIGARETETTEALPGIEMREVEGAAGIQGIPEIGINY